MGTPHIADKLDEMGIPTPHGRRWERGQITTMLEVRLLRYAGISEIDRFRTKRTYICMDDILPYLREVLELDGSGAGRPHAPVLPTPPKPGHSEMIRIAKQEIAKLNATLRRAGDVYVRGFMDAERYEAQVNRIKAELTQQGGDLVELRPLAMKDKDDQRRHLFDMQATLGLACLFGLQGIPCIYYGTDQGLSGTVDADGSDASVREALWGKKLAQCLRPGKHLLPDA